MEVWSEMCINTVRITSDCSIHLEVFSANKWHWLRIDGEISSVVHFRSNKRCTRTWAKPNDWMEFSFLTGFKQINCGRASIWLGNVYRAQSGQEQYRNKLVDVEVLYQGHNICLGITRSFYNGKLDLWHHFPTLKGTVRLLLLGCTKVHKLNTKHALS